MPPGTAHGRDGYVLHCKKAPTRQSKAGATIAVGRNAHFFAENWPEGQTGRLRPKAPAEGCIPYLPFLLLESTLF